MSADNRPHLNVTVDPDCVEWIDKQVESKRFASRSHAVDACITWYKKYVESGELPPR